jgi:hypothetical protein
MKAGYRYAFVLMADLVDSRRVGDRPGFAEDLSTHLRALNDQFGGAGTELWRPLTATKGIDEVATILSSPDLGFNLAYLLNLAVWPQRFRWGLGAGEIDVNANSEEISEMDGPAFHLAAEVLRKAEETGYLFNLEIPGMNGSVQQLVREAADVVFSIMAGWTSAQARAVKKFIESGSQAETARLLNVSPQAVSQALDRSGYDRIGKLGAAIDGVLYEHSD